MCIQDISSHTQERGYAIERGKHQFIWSWEWKRPRGLILATADDDNQIGNTSYNSYHISTFSEHGSLRIISGAIHATVPVKVILVLISFHSRLVPKSLIFTTSPRPIKTL
jgi:hypothetical protein